MLSIFTILSVIIASLGLFGLISYTTAKRTKEIGIRKILGSSVQSIILLLSKETMKLVGIAGLIASPVVWFTMTNWLQNFAYRIEIPFWIFLVVAASGALIAFAAILGNILKVALRNPTESLRYE